MRKLILTAAALMCGTAAMAQMNITTTSSADGNQPVMGPTVKTIALGDHYVVHRVMADGTVRVDTLTGKEAKLAMAGKSERLAALMADQNLTQGAGSAQPMAAQPMAAQPAASDASMSAPAATTEQTTTTEQSTATPQQ